MLISSYSFVHCAFICMKSHQYSHRRTNSGKAWWVIDSRQEECLQEKLIYGYKEITMQSEFPLPMLLALISLIGFGKMSRIIISPFLSCLAKSCRVVLLFFFLSVMRKYKKKFPTRQVVVVLWFSPFIYYWHFFFFFI